MFNLMLSEMSATTTFTGMFDVINGHKSGSVETMRYMAKKGLLLSF